MRLRVLTAAVVAFSVLLSGCQQADVVGGKPRPRFFQTVVSLSPSTTEIIKANFYGLNLIGRTSRCNYPNVVDKVPIICDVKPNYEKLASLNPDLVFYDRSLYSEADIAKIKQTVPNSVLLELNAHTIDEYVEFLRKAAGQIGSEMIVNENADRIVKARARATAGLAAHPTSMVVLESDAGQLMVAGTKSFVADEVRASGGEPVGPADDKFVPLTPEELIGKNPQIIIVNEPGFKVLMTDARFQSLSAVQASKPILDQLKTTPDDPNMKAKLRVVPIQEDVLLRAGSRVQYLIEALTLSEHGAAGK